MASKLSRRTVYVGTIVGAVALVAGFAIAGVFSNTSITSNQNGFSSNSTGTVWAGTPTLAPGASSGTCDATTANTASSPASSSLPVTLGTAATESIYFGLTGTCSASDFAEEWTFTITVSATATDVDKFVIYSTWTQTSTPASAVSADTLTMTISSSGSSVVTLNLIVDYGSNVPPASIASLDVTVSGS